MSRAREQLDANWVSIVLAVVSIIQGLAFNNLVVRFPEIYEDFRSTGRILVLVHFVLCFILLLRIFQTYLTAALDYNPWTPGMFDVLVIFIVGALEYHIFSALTVPSFDAARFHRRLALISLFAVAGYLGAVFRLREDLFPVYSDYKAEVRLQMMNVGGVIVVLAASVLIIANPGMRAGVQAALAGTAGCALTFNIIRSLNTTFGNRLRVIGANPDPYAHGRKSSGTGTVRHVVITKAEREDVRELTDILTAHFGYYYSALFDSSVRLSRRMLSQMIAFNKGRPPLGYRRFYLARDEAADEILGLLLLSGHEPSGIGGRTVGLLECVGVTLLNLGIIGTIRTYRNLRRMGSIATTRSTGELLIVYIAVKPEARRRHIGQQLISFAEALAEESRKTLTLEVREANTTGRQFFHTLGFTETNRLVCEDDAILDRGPRIVMKKDVL